MRSTGREWPSPGGTLRRHSHLRRRSAPHRARTFRPDHKSEPPITISPHFDGSKSDGLWLVPYTGPDADQLTVNGELNKLGHNVTFGHGIHAGIHWRSDSDAALLLGEAVALSFLRDRAKTYNEPFTVHLTKFDGTTATISNQ